MVERLPVKEDVVGSNPTSRAKVRTEINRGESLCFSFWGGRFGTIEI
jgi:hypothetical protein